ncbi:MAG: hypothetical protein LBD07_06225 [Spirochaetaceae bacterium]|jgi:glycerophosphoryl diester phosphodiesterase|nr:hypothetical protein [Spirochaetaceae bacterium]
MITNKFWNHKTQKIIKAAIAAYLVLSLVPCVYVARKAYNKISDKIKVDASKKQIKAALVSSQSVFSLANEAGGGGRFNPTLIAHAGGVLFDRSGAMLTYTNSKEAIVQNYNRGHRCFEIDFTLTKDGRLAAVHDWEEGKRITGKNWADAPTSKEWLEAKILGEYTTLFIDDIVNLMEIYQDMYIVTDTKEASDTEYITIEFMEIKRAAEKSSYGIMDRIVPQIYLPQMLETLYAIYEFQNVIYTLYQSPQTDYEVMQFVVSHKSITAVTMPLYRANAEFVEALTQAGKKVYVHTVNKFEEAYQTREKGVSGIYTDYLY